MNSINGCAPVTYTLNLPAAPSLPIFDINGNGQIEVTPTGPEQIGDYTLTTTACVQPVLPSDPICVESQPFTVSVWDLCNSNQIFPQAFTRGLAAPQLQTDSFIPTTLPWDTFYAPETCGSVQYQVFFEWKPWCLLTTGSITMV